MKPATIAKPVWRRLSVSALSLLLAGALLWQFLRHEDDGAPKTASSPSLAVAGSAAQAALPAPSAAPAGPPSLDAKTKPAAPAWGETLCQDLAQSLALPSGPQQLPQNRKKLEAAQNSARRDIASLLQQATSHADLRVRAAALLLQSESRIQTGTLDWAEKYPNCSKEQSCELQMHQRINAERSKDFNDIARLAIGSRDPDVYAMAYYACNAWNNASEVPDAYCQQISASQWAERDPGNGVAWMLVADKAAQEKNTAALDNAMYRMAQATTFDPRRNGLPQLRAAFDLASKSPMLQLELANLNRTVDRLSKGGNFMPVLNYCRIDAGVDANRRQLCEKIAVTLLNEEKTSSFSAFGEQIALQMGWSQQKLEQVTEERHALMGLFMVLRTGRSPTALNFDGSPAQMQKSCQESVLDAGEVLDTMQHGDYQRLRQRFAQQNRSRAELAAKYRAFIWPKEPDDSPPKK